MKQEKKLNPAQIQGKYLTFNLQSEYYGVSVKSILQIVGINDTSITSIPRTPHYVTGVINLRGNIIPVIDLRLKLDLPPCEYTDKTSIVINRLVIDNKELFMGIIVDKVIEVLDIHAPEIDQTPAFGFDYDISYIQGIAKVKNKVVSLIDIDEVLINSDIDTRPPSVLKPNEAYALHA